MARLSAEQAVLEAIVMSRLSHPNILPIHELGFVDSRELFYTMPYVETIDLREVFQRCLEPFQLGRAVSVLAQAASAIAFVHEQGLMHLDLKPGNLLVDQRGHAYVADFGLVCPIPGKPYKMQMPKVLYDLHPGPDTSATPRVEFDDDLVERTMVFVESENQQKIAGTFRYMAPEQARARPTIQSDIWAIGVMLYQALTGEHPHDVMCLNSHDYRGLAALLCGPSLHTALVRQGRQEPLPGIIEICDRALRRGPLFDSMLELEIALRHAIDGGRAVAYHARTPRVAPRAFAGADESTVAMDCPPLVSKARPNELTAVLRSLQAAPSASLPPPSGTRHLSPTLSLPPRVPGTDSMSTTQRFPVSLTEFAQRSAPARHASAAPQARAVGTPAPALGAKQRAAPPAPVGAVATLDEPSGELLVPARQNRADKDEVSHCLLELGCLPLWAIFRRARIRRVLRAALRARGVAGEPDVSRAAISAK